jgi:CheY-like chemotaxis protein
MSHELRTPLNAIVGFTQLLELDRNDPLSATQRERVGLIRSSGWHLLNLINDVLDLARIESGRSSVSMEVVHWPAVLDEAIAMVQTEAASRGIVVESRSGGDTATTVWADPVRLRQVLLNLLSNAVKYNRDRGSVQVGVRADGSHIVFAVRDSGRGMNPGQVSRLFQPFSRLGADSMSPAGTGIGLALSHRLVQQMDGAIEVDSTPGVGSEFRLRLRAARMEAAQPVALLPPPAAGLAARDDVAGTLLYIEDNPANSALVEQFLQFRPRIKLYQAADGATGLVMAAVCQPDLVLIDIRLPDMMGDEVLRQLRRQPQTQHIACVAVSANAMPYDIDAALQAGFADYWTKPLDVAQFLRGIDRLLAAAPTAPAPSPHQDAAP